MLSPGSFGAAYCAAQSELEDSDAAAFASVHGGTHVAGQLVSGPLAAQIAAALVSPADALAAAAASGGFEDGAQPGDVGVGVEADSVRVPRARQRSARRRDDAD
jgi:hypothetical protein